MDVVGGIQSEASILCHDEWSRKPGVGMGHSGPVRDPWWKSGDDSVFELASQSAVVANSRQSGSFVQVL